MQLPAWSRSRENTLRPEAEDAGCGGGRRASELDQSSSDLAGALAAQSRTGDEAPDDPFGVRIDDTSTVSASTPDAKPNTEIGEKEPPLHPGIGTHVTDPRFLGGVENASELDTALPTAVAAQ